MEKEEILDSKITEKIVEDVELKNIQGEVKKSKIIALEGVYIKTLSSLASKIYDMASSSLDDLIKNERQLFELCLRYGYEEFDNDSHEYRKLTKKEIDEIISFDFAYGQTIYTLVQALTLKVIESEKNEASEAKKN